MFTFLNFVLQDNTNCSLLSSTAVSAGAVVVSILVKYHRTGKSDEDVAKKDDERTAGTIGQSKLRANTNKRSPQRI